MGLDTGDNQPVNRGVLKTACEQVLTTHHGKLIQPFEDVGGLAAYVMASEDGVKFYLVAKASEVMERRGRQIVSVQKAILVLADQLSMPVIMFISPPGGGQSWVLFHPAEVRDNALQFADWGENRRLGAVMLNFDLSIGHQLTSPRKLSAPWHQVQERWTQRAKTSVQTKLAW